MDKQNIMQIVSLLSIMTTAISELLSISKHFKENGIVSSIRALSLYFLPFLFIQQLLLIADSLLSIVVTASLIMLVLVLACVASKKGSIKNILENIDTYMGMTIITLGSSCLLYLFHGIIINSINPMYWKNSELFLTQLKNYKISISMYEFLAQNLDLTIYYVLILIQVVILLRIILQFVNWSTCELGDNFKSFHSYFTNGQLFGTLALTLIISSGLSVLIINAFFDLF